MFWIDAICIDQSSDQERNHQVRQMGDIYRSSERVISWLGVDFLVSSFLKGPSYSWEDVYGRVAKDFHAFSEHAYWGRAWITQEVTLARKLVLAAGDEEVAFDVLPETTRDLVLPYSARSLDGQPLMYLLYLFRQKSCSIVKDRIFSLLDLCDRRDRSRITVDYSTSDLELFVQIIRAWEDSLCFCTVSLVRAALKIDYLDIPPQPYINIRMKSHDDQYCKCAYYLEESPWKSRKGLIFCSEHDAEHLGCYALARGFFCTETEQPGMYDLHILPWIVYGVWQYPLDDGVSVKVRLQKVLLEDVYELRVPIRTLTALVALVALSVPVGPHMQQAYGSCLGLNGDEGLSSQDLASAATK